MSLTSVATGMASNYAITISNGADFTATDPNNTMTGGSAGSAVYDSGSIVVTVNNIAATASWQQGDTASSVASKVMTAIKNANSNVSATMVGNGTAVKITSVQTGSSVNWPISVAVTDSNPIVFPIPSFSTTIDSMSGGAAAVTQDGVVYSYSITNSQNASGYAPNGNVVSYTDSVMGQWSFGYDSLNRLTGGSSSMGSYQGQSTCWSYDRYGNRLTESVSYTPCPGSPSPTTWAQYNASNRVSATSAGGMVNGFLYDSDGRMTGDGLNNYKYDAEGRVCAVQSTISGSLTGYQYDAEGSRIAKGTLTTFSCTSGNGFVMTNQYVLGQGGEQVAELDGKGLLKHTNIYGAGGLLATYDANGFHFQFNDWLGTRRAQANHLGIMEEVCASLLFGNGQSCSGGVPDATEQHFTGKERDAESGLDYFGARYMTSSMGRWMSPEPSNLGVALFMPQSLNHYSYALNNPYLSRIAMDCGPSIFTMRYFTLLAERYERGSVLLTSNLPFSKWEGINVPSYRPGQAHHNVQTGDQPIPEHPSGEPASGSGLRPPPPAASPELHKDVVSS